VCVCVQMMFRRRHYTCKMPYATVLNYIQLVLVVSMIPSRNDSRRNCLHAAAARPSGTRGARTIIRIRKYT
jgi:hypothetical protein